MTRGSIALGELALVLAAPLLGGSSLWAQATGSIGSSPYPYWGTAPSSYQGPDTNFSNLGLPPRSISSAAHSPSALGSIHPLYGGIRAGSLGGSLPPFLASSDSTALLPGRHYTPRPQSTAHIWLRVPPGARVWFDGDEMKQTGDLRHYFSPALTAGQKYAYQVRVRWMKDGKAIEQNRCIVVRAGDSPRLDFTKASVEERETTPKAAK